MAWSISTFPYINLIFHSSIKLFHKALSLRSLRLSIDYKNTKSSSRFYTHTFEVSPIVWLQNLHHTKYTYLLVNGLCNSCWFLVDQGNQYANFAKRHERWQIQIKVPDVVTFGVERISIKSISTYSKILVEIIFFKELLNWLRAFRW